MVLKTKIAPVQELEPRNLSQECFACNCGRDHSVNERSRKLYLLRCLQDDGSQDSYNANLSEILSITGGLLITTGALLAVSGIFPNNQARIRLFLECFGCAMILVGVIIVFISQRMKQRDELLSAGSVDLFNFHGNRLSRCHASLDSREPSRAFMNWQMSHNTAPPVSFISALPMVIRSRSGRTMSIIDGKLGDSGSLRESVSDSGYKLELELVKIFDRVDPNNWIPEHGYGEGHQAAIESALSTVLTVSTLAGCRAGGFAQEHCCLHHAVQHKLNALKWTKRLRASHPSKQVAVDETIWSTEEDD